MENLTASVEALLNETAYKLRESHAETNLEEVYASLFRSDESAFAALLEIARRKCFAQIYAIRALRGLKDPRAVKPLMKILEESPDEDDVEKAAIIETLGEIGDIDAISVINSFLANPPEDIFIREAALEALIKLPPSTSSIDILTKFILDNSSSGEANKAVLVLKNIKDPKAVIALVNLIENSDSVQNPENNNYYHSFINEKMGTETLSASSEWNRGFPNFAIASLFDLHEEYAVAPIMKMLDSPNEIVRRIGILALGNYPRKQVVKRLSSFLHDPELPTREAAISSLASIGDRDSVLPIIELLRDKDKELRKKAATALAKITGKSFFFGNTSYKKWHKWYEKHNT